MIEIRARDALGNEVLARVGGDPHQPRPADPHQPYELNPLAYDPSDGVTVRELSAFTLDMVIGWLAAAGRWLRDRVWPLAREALCLVLVPSCYVVAMLARDSAKLAMKAGLGLHRSSKLLASSLRSAESSALAKVGAER